MEHIICNNCGKKYLHTYENPKCPICGFANFYRNPYAKDINKEKTHTSIMEIICLIVLLGFPFVGFMYYFITYIGCQKEERTLIMKIGFILTLLEFIVIFIFSELK